jgi:hypothetical protein
MMNPTFLMRSWNLESLKRLLGGFDMAQVVGRLPSTCEALRSSLSTRGRGKKKVFLLGQKRYHIIILISQTSELRLREVSSQLKVNVHVKAKPREAPPAWTPTLPSVIAPSLGFCTNQAVFQRTQVPW